MISAIITLIIAFLSLIVLMIIHEFGHFIIAKKFGVQVDEFGIGYPPRMFGKKFGETIYSVNWLPLGAFVRIKGEEGGVDDYRSFLGLKIWKRVLIVLGGVIAFWIAAIVIFTVVFAIGAELPVGEQDVQGMKNPQVKIMAVSPGSPAELAGLKPRDVIKSIKVDNSVSLINKVSEFQEITKAQAGKQIVVEIERNGTILNQNLTVRAVAPAGQGLVGINLERMATLAEKYPWYLAPIQGTTYTWEITIGALKGLYTTLHDLFVGKGAPQGAEFAGPIGITVFLANAASYGVGFFLYFIGMISVFLAIFNLFPIPALDGGKLIFLLIEKIKGKPVSPAVEQGITVTFFVILIALSLFITVRFDIPRVSDYLKSSIQR